MFSCPSLTKYAYKILDGDRQVPNMELRRFKKLLNYKSN